MSRWIAFALMVFAASPAFAQSYSREGFSLGASLSLAEDDFDGGSFDEAEAFGLAASYRVAPNFAIDGRFEQTTNFDGDAGPFDVDVDLWTLTANAQFFMLTDRFQPYLIGGLGIGHVNVDIDPGPSDDETDPLLRFGVGLDSYVTPQFVIGTEAAYNLGLDDLNDFNYWTLSAIFRLRF